MQQTGWLGHDYVHGRGDGCWKMGRLLGGVVNGFSSEWWSDKHNTHHVFPNYMGIDTDIQVRRRHKAAPNVCGLNLRVCAIIDSCARLPVFIY